MDRCILQEFRQELVLSLRIRSGSEGVGEHPEGLTPAPDSGRLQTFSEAAEMFPVEDVGRTILGCCHGEPRSATEVYAHSDEKRPHGIPLPPIARLRAPQPLG